MTRLVTLIALALLGASCRYQVLDRDGDGFQDCQRSSGFDLRDCHGEGDTADWVGLIDYPYGNFNPLVNDCDDTNANVHPGAMEICDGLDNDCNGDFDDWRFDPADAPDELDCDGDGFVKITGDDSVDCAPWDAAVQTGCTGNQRRFRQ